MPDADADDDNEDNELLGRRFGVPSEEFAKRDLYFPLPTIDAVMFDEDPIALGPGTGGQR